MKSHLFTSITSSYVIHFDFHLYGLMFWLTQFVQEHASTHNSPASRQEHVFPDSHTLFIMHSADELGLEHQPKQMAECASLEWRVHHCNLTSYDQQVRSAFG